MSGDSPRGRRDAGSTATPTRWPPARWIMRTACIGVVSLVLAPFGLHAGVAARSLENDGADEAVTPRRAAKPDKPNTIQPVKHRADTAKRKPVLLPANQRRNRSGTPPAQVREERATPRRFERTVNPAPLPPARDVPGDRGAPLGVPAQYDPRLITATPPIVTAPLPPARQVPGESGIPLGLGPLAPGR